LTSFEKLRRSWFTINNRTFPFEEAKEEEEESIHCC
jgi:hypothetical protein